MVYLIYCNKYTSNIYNYRQKRLTMFLTYTLAAKPYEMVVKYTTATIQNILCLPMHRHTCILLAVWYHTEDIVMTDVCTHPYERIVWYFVCKPAGHIYPVDEIIPRSPICFSLEGNNRILCNMDIYSSIILFLL